MMASTTATASAPMGEVIEGGPFEGIGMSAADVVQACYPVVSTDKLEELEDLYHRFCCRQLEAAAFRNELKELVGGRKLWTLLCRLAPILVVPVVPQR